VGVSIENDSSKFIMFEIIEVNTARTFSDFSSKSVTFHLFIFRTIIIYRKKCKCSVYFKLLILNVHIYFKLIIGQFIAIFVEKIFLLLNLKKVKVNKDLKKCLSKKVRFTFLGPKVFQIRIVRGSRSITRTKIRF